MSDKISDDAEAYRSFKQEKSAGIPGPVYYRYFKKIFFRILMAYVIFEKIQPVQPV